MKLQLNRIAHPVTVLGPGRRLGVWVQGCGIGCIGCASVDTWDRRGGAAVPVAELAHDLAAIVRRKQLTGLTLSGGEPTDQGEALAELVQQLRAGHPGAGDAFDVLLFTGRTATAARRAAPSLWEAVDAAVCGPYRAGLPGTGGLVASSNQELFLLTPLARTLYKEQPPAATTLQAAVCGEDINLIGLPAAGALPLVEQGLDRRGIQLESTSWQTR